MPVSGVDATVEQFRAELAPVRQSAQTITSNNVAVIQEGLSSAREAARRASQIIQTASSNLDQMTWHSDAQVQAQALFHDLQVHELDNHVRSKNQFQQINAAANSFESA